MNMKQAVNIAQGCLLWLMESPDELSHFMQASGTSVDDLRSRMGDPEFLGFVMEFVLMDDGYVVAAASEIGIKPEDFLRARSCLPGGDNPNWT